MEDGFYWYTAPGKSPVVVKVENPTEQDIANGDNPGPWVYFPADRNFYGDERHLEELDGTFGPRLCEPCPPLCLYKAGEHGGHGE